VSATAAVIGGTFRAPRRSREARPGRRSSWPGSGRNSGCRGTLGLPVHQQDLALGDGAAALQTGSVRPRRSRSSAVPIAMPSTAMVRSVRQTVCCGRAKDALQQWHVFGQMTAIGKEARERLRRPDDDQLGGVEHAGRAHGIEPDGDAGAGVPDPRRRRVKESRKSEG
jgi:hypothetical protein